MGNDKHLARPANGTDWPQEANGHSVSAEDSLVQMLTEGDASTTTVDSSMDSVAVSRPLIKKSTDYRGKRLGSYEVQDLLGKGGVGLVYLAFDHRLTRRVALKLLRTDDHEAAHRLLDEARAQARVDHENVCRVYEAGEIEGQTFIAMQYIEGLPLNQAFRSMTLEEKIDVVLRVAEGLDVAHRQNLIHRDIKPGNILVERTPRGEWKPYILDFGLAREQAAPGETTTGEVKGTPNYMPPEQVKGEVHSLDARADIYSLGATLYEGVAGRQLFADGSGGLAVMLKVLNEDPEPVRSVNKLVPIDVESIVMRCLEKDPARRYATIRELADDLQRFLDGESVTARPISNLNRVWRRLKKRRVAALTASLIVTVVVSLGVLVYSQLHAAKKAGLMEKYRQDVRYIQELLRHTYQEPIHDVTPTKEKVYGRLDRIRTQAEKQGRIALGPSSYALGRGYLELHDYENAHRHLRTAWDSGTRDPEVGYSLGRALGGLYHQALVTARRIQDQAQREERIAEIQKEYREPALEFLLNSQEVEVDSIELVEALVAFWEENYDVALAKAAAAYEPLPWLYEALILQGDVHLALSLDLRRHGNHEEAVATYERARQAYDKAAKKGRSDVRIYEGQCQLAVQLLQFESYEGGSDLRRHYEYGLETCARGRRVDPGRAESYALESILHWRLGEYEFYQGRDPTALIESATAMAQQALAEDPNDIDTHVSLGWAWALYASWDLQLGQQSRSPAKNVEKAVAAFERAIDIDPNFYEAHGGVGYARHTLAQWEMDFGISPEASLGAAISALERAVALSHDFVNGLDNLAWTYGTRSWWEVTQGKDPRPSVDQVEGLSQRLLAAHPGRTWAMIYPGDAWVYQARWELEEGIDPQKTLQAAMASYEAALATDPNEGFIHIGLGSLRTLNAKRSRFDGRDPQPSFTQSQEHIARGLELTGPDSWSYQIELELYIAWAEWKTRSGRSPHPEIARGLAAARQARADFPEAAVLQALEGVLFVLDAEARKDSGQREKARAALAEALAANANLNHQYGPWLERAAS